MGLMGKPKEANDTVYMTEAQSKIMCDWVKEIVSLINVNHADFHELIEKQYPEKDAAFHQSVVVGCVCQAIMHSGIQYLKSISEGNITNDKIEDVLHFSLYHELKQLSDPFKGPHTQQ